MASAPQTDPECDKWIADKSAYCRIMSLKAKATGLITVSVSECNDMKDKLCCPLNKKYCSGPGWILYAGIGGGVLVLIIIIVIIACCCCKKGGRGGGGKDQKALEGSETEEHI